MSNRRKLLLLGWDGADWDHVMPLLEAGEMPNLESLINSGVMGNISTLEPILSPMLWNSVATGKHADEHGILGFIEPDPSNGGARMVASTSRKVKALWNILSQSGRRSNVVNWWASHPAEPIDGSIVSNAFTSSKWSEEIGWRHMKGTFHPPRVAKDVANLRVHLDEVDDQSILPFIPKAAEVDQDDDRRIEMFAEHLAQCASIQAAATHLMATEDWDLSAVYFEGIDHFCHTFMEYQAPKMPHIREEDFEIYKDVVSGAYRFHDMMLGGMLEMIDDDTYVILCSDHGFYSGNARPAHTPNEPTGPAYWHRPLGILVMRGPNIKKDERVYGAGLLDIAPTALAMLGLPVAEDMNGKVLLSAFDPPPEITRIPSWESVVGDDGMHPPGFEVDGEVSSGLMDQFIALGYVEDPGKDKEEASRKAKIETEYNLAKTYLGSSRPEKALPILQKLVEESPWEHRFLVYLARCYYDSGHLLHAKAIVEKAFPDQRKMPASTLAMLGRISARLGDYTTGESFLNLALKRAPTLRGLHVEIGRTFLQQRQWEKAIESCERELKNNPTSAAAHQIIASSRFRMGEYALAVESALNSVAIQHWFPQAHFILGAALSKLGQPERAAQAFAISLQMNPRQAIAHRILANIYRNDLGDPEKAEFHRMNYNALRSRREDRKKAKLRAQQTFDLPDIPSSAERVKKLREERPREKMGTTFRRRKASGKTFVVVSGLPRSGTSLMMQMLEAGGLPPLTDGERTADVDNPGGYYEWEAIKQIDKRPEILDPEGLDQKAVKVISALLSALPEQHSYKVIFMRRPCMEIAASQRKMIERLGTEGPDADEEQIAAQLERHQANVLTGLERMNHCESLVVDFPQLITDTGPTVERLVDFLGKERIPQFNKMSDVVRPELYREKASAAKT
jgi:predicted AlkP superfamily phosphohydrolase/phosphomutase/tetratricopeptide (TPR) repeat protein